MAEAQLLSKLSLKGMKAQPPKHSLKEGEAFPIATFIGTARAHETVDSPYGDSTRILGNFEGINLRTGEVFRANKAFLPEVIESILVEGIDTLDPDDPKASIEFALEIGVQHSEKGNMGYAYTVKPLVPLKENDSLGHLRAHAEAVLKALPAPQPVKAPVAETTETQAESTPAKKGKK